MKVRSPSPPSPLLTGGEGGGEREGERGMRSIDSCSLPPPFPGDSTQDVDQDLCLKRSSEERTHSGREERRSVSSAGLVNPASPDLHPTHLNQHIQDFHPTHPYQHIQGIQELHPSPPNQDLQVRDRVEQSQPSEGNLRSTF